MLSSNLSSAALGSHPEEVLLHTLRARLVVCNCRAVSHTGSDACAEPSCAHTFLVCLGCAGLAGVMQLVWCGACLELLLSDLPGSVGLSGRCNSYGQKNEVHEPCEVPNCSGSLQQALEENLTPEHCTNGLNHGVKKNQM